MAGYKIRYMTYLPGRTTMVVVGSARHHAVNTCPCLKKARDDGIEIVTTTYRPDNGHIPCEWCEKVIKTYPDRTYMGMLS